MSWAYGSTPRRQKERPQSRRLEGGPASAKRVHVRPDDPDTYQVMGPPELPAPATLVIEALGPVVTQERMARIAEVVRQRTRDVVPVLEAITDPHNASAVLRSADAFGLQKVCAIEAAQGFVASRGVSKGSHRWLDVHRYRSAEACVGALKHDGYKVFVATIGGEVSVESLVDHPKVAVVFGNEHRGPSDTMHALADGTFEIPMSGFVESFNVSVAAAITLFALTRNRERGLPKRESEELTARFLMNSVRDAERIVAQYTRR